MVPTQICTICFRAYQGDHPAYCSLDCQQAAELFDANIGGTIRGAKPGDPRIFFYDASFGALTDRWTVLCLKRLHTKDVELQKEIDFHMHRIRKTLETKICSRQPMPDEKELIIRLGRDLLALNAKGWQLNCLARNNRLSREIRAEPALALLELADQRINKIRQLDLIVSGRTHAWKFY